ncbi:hypothetical protein Lser_V15G30576 [Lactuca serriola]
MIPSYETIDGSSHNVETISSSVFDKLTDELLIETLIRLPLKPANICKCISVRFRSLISSSNFVRCYLNHHQINESFALCYDLDGKRKIRPSSVGMCMAFESPIFESPGFSLSFLQETIQYLASNNGLVLCCADLCPPVVYFVCNPLTKQWITLPPPPTDVKSSYIGFTCNPQYSCNDNQEQRMTTSFKVVCIQVALRDTLSLEIFCSESGKWTNENYMLSSTSVNEFFYRCNFGYPSSAVVCGGLLHWDNLSKTEIFTYDPYRGICESIKYPPGITESSSDYCLGESGGRLRYADYSKSSKTYRVWQLKDCSNDGGEWFLLHKVNILGMKSTVQTAYNDLISLLLPHPLDQDIVFFWCLCSLRILEYNMRTKLLKLPCFPQDAKVKYLMIPVVFPFVLPCWPTTVPIIQQHGES